MRVAVVLPSHVRTFERCWPNWLKHVVEPNGWKCRYFIHTYDLAEMTQETSRKLDKVVRPPEAESRALVEKALATLAPHTEFVAVDSNPPNVARTLRELRGCGIYQGRGGNAEAQCLQTKKLQMAYEPLRTRLNEFDLVVRWRFDMEFASPIEVPELRDDQIVTIARLSMPHDCMCDCFAVMRPIQRVCDAYFDVYDSLLPRAQRKKYLKRYTLENHFGLNMIEHGIERLVLPNPDNTIKCVRFDDP